MKIVVPTNLGELSLDELTALERQLACGELHADLDLHQCLRLSCCVRTPGG